MPWYAEDITLQQGLLATYLIPGCVGRGVRLGSENSSGAGGGGVWAQARAQAWAQAWAQARAQAQAQAWAQAWAQAGPKPDFWKSGTWKSGNLGSKKSKK